MEVLAERGPTAVAVERPSRPPAARFPCFDGLRALAALAVLVFHSNAVFVIENPTWVPHVAEIWLTKLGASGVAVFFVISGFLLYRPFALAILSDRPAPEPLPFWKRRFCRILPAYWVALAVAVFIVGGTNVKTVGQAITAFGLLQNYRFQYEFLGLAVAWTLVIELSFYIVLPPLAWIVRRLAERFESVESRLRVQLVFLAVLAVIGLSSRALLYFGVHNFSTPAGSWFRMGSLLTWLPSFLDWFAFGMAMAVGSSWLSLGRRIPGAVAFLGRVPVVSWLISLALYWLRANITLGLFGVSFARSHTAGFLDWGLAGAGAAFFVLPAVFGVQSQSGVRRLLRTPFLVLCGVVSYGIYLWHVVIWDVVRQHFLTMPMVGQFVVVLVGTLLVAALSFEFVERPIVRWSGGHVTNLWTSGAGTSQRHDLENEGVAVWLRRLAMLGLVVLIVFAAAQIHYDTPSTASAPTATGTTGTRVVVDDFSRASGPGLGSASTGQPWTVLTGAWSIVNKHATTAGRGLAIIRAPVTHVLVIGGGVAFRCTDVGNCWSVTPVPGRATWQIDKVVGGKVQHVGDIVGVASEARASVGVSFEGSRINIAINHVLRKTFVDPDLAGAVGVGLAGSAALPPARWSSFEADR